MSAILHSLGWEDTTTSSSQYGDTLAGRVSARTQVTAACDAVKVPGFSPAKIGGRANSFSHGRRERRAEALVLLPFYGTAETVPFHLQCRRLKAGSGFTKTRLPRTHVRGYDCVALRAVVRPVRLQSCLNLTAWAGRRRGGGICGSLRA